MVEYTTIKVSKDTVKMLHRFKSIFEYEMGHSYTLDGIIRTLTITADYAYASSHGFTDLSLNEYLMKLEEILVLEKDSLLASFEPDEIDKVGRQIAGLMKKGRMAP